MLEWMTSEEAEKQAKEDLLSYLKQMLINIVFGIIFIFSKNVILIVLGAIWIITPFIMWYISKAQKQIKSVEELNKKEKQYIKDIGKRTWDFFDKYLVKENNYLITDNYQEDRKEKIVLRTSSTNIGLSLLAVISANDLGYIDKEKALKLLKEMILTIESLPKWNGHLYNWYQIRTKEPLVPRYISTVDSGNFVGYLFVVKAFLLENIEKSKEESKTLELKNLENIVDNLIKNTDFSLLYNNELQMFSIGYNVRRE